MRLQGLELDGQTVAVPSWSVFHSDSSFGIRSQDDVLVDLVQGVSDMYWAVCVWRSIMENEGVSFAVFIFGWSVLLLPGIKVVGASFPVSEKLFG